ncbi:MAG: hypothetical protein WD048_08720 [Chitinophagales bacterium]
MHNKSFINGADYFQLYLDRENKKQGAATNAVRLLLIFEGKVDLNALKEKLENADILSEINGLDLKSSAFKNYFFWQKGASKKTPVSIQQWNERPEALQPFEDLEQNEWLRINLLNGQKKDAVLFHMHHIIADNKGFQQLIQKLNENPGASIEVAQQIKKCGTVATFFKHTWQMLKPKKGRMLTFANKQAKHSGIKFHLLSKNINEVSTLKNAMAGVVIPGASTVFLSHISAVIEKWCKPVQKGDYFWVPVPVDRRKKGQKDFSLGNQLSFLFYKIECGQSDAQRMESLQTQIIEQAKKRAVKNYEQLSNTMTKFPYPLYKAMLELPDRGKFCSFTYSDLGHNFKNMTRFMGENLSDVINFPSVPLAPGIVFVTMHYRNNFHLVMGTDENIISDSDAKLILREISKKI